ncbi:MAG: hypothetical protein GY771_10720 [bacterium]|nr:hypothetical protein [bacterium]
MEGNKDALTPVQRDMLFGKIREDGDFRDLMKRDWRSALEQLNIDPELVGETLEKDDERFAISPFSEVFIVIETKFMLKADNYGTLDAVNFETRQ